MKQIVYDILNDPLSYPDGMRNWLTQYIGMNSQNTPPLPNTANPSTPKP